MVTTQASLNRLANERTLPPWASWVDGQAPDGYFRLPMTEQAARFYQENGFLVVDGALSRAEIDALNAEAAQICRGARGDVRGLTPAAPDESDLDVMRKYLCIHFPHKISTDMYATLAHPAIVEVLSSVIGANVKCMQSMLFIKASGKPGQAWHQDEFFIPTRDRSLAGAWMALDDATVENGCLWVVPGSHRHGIIWPQRTHDDARFDCTGEAMYYPYTDDDAVPVEVRKGSIVFFNGYLLHRSLPNYATSRLPALAGQPLYERRVAAALARLPARRVDRNGRLPRHCHGRRTRPARLERHRGPRHGACAAERRGWLRQQRAQQQITGVHGRHERHELDGRHGRDVRRGRSR